MNDRLFPARPILAVSAAVFRKGRVAHRAPSAGAAARPFQPARRGVEVGETMRPLGRELMEEVGVEAEIIAFHRHVEAIIHESDRVRTHFVIAPFVARWTRGEPRLSEEVDAVDWLDLAPTYPRRRRRSLAKFRAPRGSKVRPLS